jgi:catechol 2,3-dioxygenase-like lactoylglutathione lyase family enzyme
LFGGYHHIGLVVDNAGRSLKFYTDGLGGKVTFSFPMGDSGKTVYLIDLGGNAVVEIIPRGQNGAEANARWAHIAVAASDARKAYDLALKAGAIPQSEPNDGNLGTMPVCTAFVKGPDGEVIEFFQTK